LPGSILRFPDQVDQLGQEAAHRDGAAVQVHVAEEPSPPGQLDVVGDADVATCPPGPVERMACIIDSWVATASITECVHRTKPQTAALGLTDSPAGLAAWIVEKLRAWSDCDGNIERRFTKDEILTDVTRRSCASFFRPYPLAGG
jgi:hypothetical protein